MRQYVESENELITHFTSALGVGAQSYEPRGGGVDPGAASRAMALDDFTVIASERRHTRRHREALAAHGAIEATLALVGAEDARTLRLAFYPRNVGSGMYEAGIDRRWAALGLDTQAAAELHARWQGAKPERAAVGLVQWLDDDATAAAVGPEKVQTGLTRVQKAIRDEAQVRLHLALARYDVLRRERERVERTAKQAAKDAAASKVSAVLGNRIKAQPRQALVSLSSAIAMLLADHADLIDFEPAE